MERSNSTTLRAGSRQESTHRSASTATNDRELMRRNQVERQLVNRSRRRCTDVEVPSEFRNFLLGDYCKDGTRLLAFCTENAKSLLDSVKTYIIDGSFSLGPPIPFRDFYTIYGDIGGSKQNPEIVPLIYCITSDRRKVTLIKMFRVIKIQIPTWKPRKFLTDFEENVVNALCYVFPNIVVGGYICNFRNKLWHKASQFRIKNKHHKRIVKLCCALPLLPRDYVMAGWDYIKIETSDFSEAESLDMFIKYMEFWLKPRIIPTWNAFNRPEVRKESNYIEPWQKMFLKKFPTRPRDLTKFLKVLFEEPPFCMLRGLKTKKSTKFLNKKGRALKIEDNFIDNVQTQLLDGIIDVSLFLEKLR